MGKLVTRFKALSYTFNGVTYSSFANAFKDLVELSIEMGSNSVGTIEDKIQNRSVSMQDVNSKLKRIILSSFTSMYLAYKEAESLPYVYTVNSCVNNPKVQRSISNKVNNFIKPTSSKDYYLVSILTESLSTLIQKAFMDVEFVEAFKNFHEKETKNNLQDMHKYSVSLDSKINHIYVGMLNMVSMIEVV